ncbi:MAG: 5'-nucleotidase C-terminal domain-containing protein, partial [Clostridia bacterium]
YSRVTTLKKQYEAAGATVVLLDAGDVLHGLPIANLLKGENIVQILNKVGYDAFVPGNHDFNYGTDRLLEIAGKKVPNTQATTFGGKVLSANYVKTDDKSLPFDANVVIVRGGKKIGIFGLSTSETKTKSHPNNTAGYEFADNVATATAQRDALKAQGCDYVIALTHLGLDESSGNLTSKYLAENVTGLDLIVDGHSHSTLANGQLVNGTLIVSSGSYLANIGVVVLDNANKTASLVADKTIVEDVETLALVNKLKADTETGLAVVVGHTSVDLNGTRNYVRSGETNLGNFATDAMRVYGEADLAFTNGGGIRDNIKKGEITKKHLVTVFPFGNYVVTKEVSVPVIKQMLEHGIKGYPSASGGFPHISGFSFTFDFTRPVGSKVTSITIGDTVAYDNGVYMP